MHNTPEWVSRGGLANLSQQGTAKRERQAKMRKLNGRPVQTTRPRLSLDQIVAATIALIDEQGIAAASMRTVARQLQVQPMALYRYVENREDLFDEVVDHIVGELDDDASIQHTVGEDGWRSYLNDLAWGVRRYARAHPHAFPLVATRPPSAPWINPPLRSLRWIETMLNNLFGAGFTDEQVLFTYRSFNSFLLGHLLLRPAPWSSTTPNQATDPSKPATTAEPTTQSTRPTPSRDPSVPPAPPPSAKKSPMLTPPANSSVSTPRTTPSFTGCEKA